MRHRVSANAVFLNIPYDQRFTKLYLAYIVGLIHLGQEPRVTLGIPGGERRLDRIFELIRGCRYSVHDLCRVELDRHPPRTPRFNMPFELGMAVAWSKLEPELHSWFVFEALDRRLSKSLSDLNGSDANIHGSTIEGVMRELCNSFVRVRSMPTVPDMLASYRLVASQAAEIQRRAGASSLFTTRVFKDLCFAASAAVALQF